MKQKRTGIEVRLNAPNWPAQVSQRRLLKSDNSPSRGSNLSKIRWPEGGSPTGTTFPPLSIAARAATAGMGSRPATSGFLMRQCRACKVLYEGYHSCSRQTAVQVVKIDSGVEDEKCMAVHTPRTPTDAPAATATQHLQCEHSSPERIERTLPIREDIPIPKRIAQREEGAEPFEAAQKKRPVRVGDEKPIDIRVSKHRSKRRR